MTAAPDMDGTPAEARTQPPNRLESMSTEEITQWLSSQGTFHSEVFDALRGVYASWSGYNSYAHVSGYAHVFGNAHVSAHANMSSF